MSFHSEPACGILSYPIGAASSNQVRPEVGGRLTTRFQPCSDHNQTHHSSCDKFSNYKRQKDLRITKNNKDSSKKVGKIIEQTIQHKIPSCNFILLVFFSFSITKSNKQRLGHKSYNNLVHMSRLMGKPTICICENKDADQLRGNREADQRLCFRYTDGILPLLFKSEISSFQPASVTVQPGLCRTCSETTLLVFPRGGSYYKKFLGKLSHK